MDKQRKLAHIVAYYLSRFDKEALLHLGFKTDREAFSRTATILGLVPNYIKFRRDEFDVGHDHRKGWHKRPMSLSIASTINALKELEELTLREIVKEIISGQSDESTDDTQERLMAIFPKDKKKKPSGAYVPRGVTGKKAEDLFTAWYPENKHVFPFEGVLTDTRDLGCGYDFEISSADGQCCYIEVKGLAAAEGGILFTDKEWETAKEKSSLYHLVLVKNIDKIPAFCLLPDPAAQLSAQRNLMTVIQVNWIVSKNSLTNLIKAS